jgi:A/G-specific adenine glycosylase
MTNPPTGDLAGLLLAWYDRHARKLPWRIGPGERERGVRPDPYRVWLSEVMLQQTTVAAVKSYFEKFIERWPGVSALAAAPRDDVMKAWAGLGYYARARNLKACAEKIASEFGGEFPQNVAELLTLPGIGDYTAAAIAAIAFDEPAPVVDGNIERVIARMFAIDKPLPAAKANIRAHQARLTPTKRAGDYAQALMDLGATICTPKRPACTLCPWSEACLAHAAGNSEAFPVRAARTKRPTRYGNAYVAIREDGAILLRQRDERGLLGGMSEVPGTEWTGENSSTAAHAPFPAAWRSLPNPVIHVFTHFRLELSVFVAEVPTMCAAPGDAWWADAESIPNEALPSVFKKTIEAAAPGATKRLKRRAA